MRIQKTFEKALNGLLPYCPKAQRKGTLLNKRYNDIAITINNHESLIPTKSPLLA